MNNHPDISGVLIIRYDALIIIGLEVYVMKSNKPLYPVFRTWLSYRIVLFPVLFIKFSPAPPC